MTTTVTSAEPTHDEVALLAFLAWEKDGRQPGGELTYWFRAEAELRAAKEKKAMFTPKPWPPTPSATTKREVTGKKELSTAAKRSTTVKAKVATKAPAARSKSPAGKARR